MKRFRIVYYLFCVACLFGLSSIRSAPVHGKLDFYLLDGMPWWEPWRPMIESILEQPQKPILSDMITDTVLRAVFAQPSPGFRHVRYFYHLDIKEMERVNACQPLPLPVGSIYLLLAEHDDDGGTMLPSSKEVFMLKILAEGVSEKKSSVRSCRYRCIINLHDFSPSWVPFETGHWSPLWTKPSLVYDFDGKHGKELRLMLHKYPPATCRVYF